MHTCAAWRHAAPCRPDSSHHAEHCSGPGSASASGRAAEDGSIRIRAERGALNYGIASTDYLEYAFRTDSYELAISFDPDGSWSYVSDTMLTVRGQAAPFRHRDRNTLVKVGEPTPNPLFRIRQGQGR